MTRSVIAEPAPVETDRLVAHVLGGGATEPTTLTLLWTASQGDDELMRALILAGLGTGELSRRGGRWYWGRSAASLTQLIAARLPVLRDAQLAALATMTRPLTEPYAVVSKARTAPCPPPAGTPAVRLTPREQEILVLLAEGLTARAMARRLGLSPRTVNKHQENLYRKLGTSDRLSTVLSGQRLGLTPPS